MNNKHLNPKLFEFFKKELRAKEIDEKNQLKNKRFRIKESPLSEEIFSAIVHGIGTLIAIVELVLLVIFAQGVKNIVAVAIFAITSIILFLMSCLYHAFPKGTTKRVFKRFDHLSIYLLIAGTYTPFALIALGGTRGWMLFGIQWGLALIGIVFKSIWIDRLHFLHIALFLIMGWIILAFDPLGIYKALTFPGFMFLLFGGISYTIGVIFYVIPFVKFNHAIWHFFVLFGNVLHFFAILFYLL